MRFCDCARNDRGRVFTAGEGGPVNGFQRHVV